MIAKNPLFRSLLWVSVFGIVFTSIILTLYQKSARFDGLMVALFVLLLAEMINFWEMISYSESIEPDSPPDGENGGDVTALIVAYLPNEQHIVRSATEYFCSLLNSSQCKRVILSYNTPHALPVISDLMTISEQHPEFKLIHAHDSSTKAENINAALDCIETPYVGIFDTDARPRPDAFSRASAWLNAGYDFVQGANIPRLENYSLLTRIVFVEYLIKYLISYQARSHAWNVSYFSGSNGYWRRDTLSNLQAKKKAQVEDIDLALRALRSGARLKYDPGIVAEDDPPPTCVSWWRQRVRWGQGWAQLLRWHQIGVFGSRSLNFTQKLIWTYFLLGRRFLVPLTYFAIFGFLVMVSVGLYKLESQHLVGLVCAAGVQMGTQTWAVVQLLGQDGKTQSLYRSELSMLLLYPIAFPLYEVLRELTVLWASPALVRDPTSWTVTPRYRSSTTR